MPAAYRLLPTDSRADAWAVFEVIAQRYEHVFWLDSGTDAVDGMSYLGWSTRPLVAEQPDVGFLTALRTELDLRRAPSASEPLVEGAPPTGFALGWVGWIGYEFRTITMGEPSKREARHPAAAMLWVDGCLALDHRSGTWSLLLDGVDGALQAQLHEVLEVAQTMPRSMHSHGDADAAPLAVRWRYDDERYLSMIDDCRAAISAGDAYLLCLTNEARVDGRFDAVAAYAALRVSSPSHHGGFIRINGTALLSASPERFLEVSPQGVVETRPIKGTRPRGSTPFRDELLHRELRESEKERAENLMIVDLMRNDLGRICEVGSVEVPSLLRVESYAQVHQLVSCVRGRLGAGRDGIDALEACFPAGSMTGAPKLSATRILDRLEQRARGVYSGAFGYLGRDGRVDLAMVIRSIVIDRDGATVGSGGGITALSEPLAEVEEVRLKAAALLAALATAHCTAQ